MGRLDGRVAIVTGGARGMGATHVRGLVREGAKVHFTDILEGDGEALAGELGKAALFSTADVARGEDWGRVVRDTEARFGPVNILVNNAGVVIRCPIEEMSEADYRKVIEVNQIGVFLGMQATIPSLRKAGGGSIVNVSSIAGMIGRPQTIAYAASKFAIRGMTKVAARELGIDNIRVNSIHPGAVMTPMFESMDRSVQDSLLGNVPLNRWARPEEVTQLVIFLASDQSSYCSGAEFIVDGGMLA